MLLLLCFAIPAFAGHKNVALLISAGSTEKSAPEFVSQCIVGLSRAKQQYGKAIATKVFDLKDYKSKAEILAQASKWADLVIIPVADFINELPAVIKDNPKVTYVTFDEVPNARVVQFDDEQTGFLAGALAAIYLENTKDSRIKKDSKIAAIFGPDIPAINKMKQGFKTGIWYINKKIDPIIVNVESFTDKEAAVDLARRLHAKNADIIFTACGSAGLGVCEIAESAGFWTIGVDSEAERRFPKGVLASAVKRSDYVVNTIVKMYMQKKLFDKNVTIGIKDEAIGISIWTREAKTNIPLNIRKRVDAIEDKLEQGLILLGK